MTRSSELEVKDLLNWHCSNWAICITTVVHLCAAVTSERLFNPWLTLIATPNHCKRCYPLSFECPSATVAWPGKEVPASITAQPLFQWCSACRGWRWPTLVCWRYNAGAVTARDHLLTVPSTVAPAFNCCMCASCCDRSLAPSSIFNLNDCLCCHRCNCVRDDTSQVLVASNCHCWQTCDVP